MISTIGKPVNFNGKSIYLIRLDFNKMVKFFITKIEECTFYILIMIASSLPIQRFFNTLKY